MAECLQSVWSLPMRLLGEASEVCRCEALFYHRLAGEVAVGAPKCYFVDYSDVTGEFVLLLEVIEFGTQCVLPLKHRIRDAATLEEQYLFVREGGKMNASLWGDGHPCLQGAPRFDQTHRQLWVMAQLIARRGLHFTVKRTVGGRKVNQRFMTWSPPPELVGKEADIIGDMPAILRSLCEDKDMVAFGHNDLTTDNAYFMRGTDGQLSFGVFDWQQSCINNVGQEWAWNWHFLEPEFLEAHEDTLICWLLQTYKESGIEISREAFLESYVLGTVQMYVFGGGAMQMLLRALDKRGLLESLLPNDPRCRDETLGKDVTEHIVGAEMTRRTFTNVCGIMRRHGFARAWSRWRERHGCHEASSRARAKAD